MEKKKLRDIKYLLMVLSVFFIAVFAAMIIYQAATREITNPVVFDIPLVLAAFSQLAAFLLDTSGH